MIKKIEPTHFMISKLNKDDYFFGFLDILSQLTNDPNFKNHTYDEFCEHYDKINSDIYVIKNKINYRIVGCASIFYEKKFIHNFSSVAHIEDVVIDSNYRGLNLGKLIIDHLVNLAKNNNCYKIILNCADNNINFYVKCGFEKKNNEMALYFSNIHSKL